MKVGLSFSAAPEHRLTTIMKLLIHPNVGGGTSLLPEDIAVLKADACMVVMVKEAAWLLALLAGHTSCVADFPSFVFISEPLGV